ncbi:MAG TPA: fatty acid--CoA ligase family protein, partial [Rhodocyclaceae bacterium]|nr:fatty acid--CoA ligase family protein [Rhodocyclaceae bacterium]
VLQYINVNGEPAHGKRLKAFKEKLPFTQIVYSYGLSEAGVRVTQGVFSSDDDATPSVGRPLDDVEIRIEKMTAMGTNLPDGVGRIAVRSPSIMVGYFAEGFDTASVDDGWLKTEDLGRLDADGSLYIYGRLDDAMLRGGEVIHPEAIESTLRSVAGLHDCAVFHTDTGAFVRIVCAYVADEAVDQSILRTACKESLPAYSLPNEYVRVEQLGLGSSGKMSRRHLKDLYIAGNLASRA